MDTGREQISKWWGEAWDAGLWAASWKASLDGLSAQEAAWSPAPGRHSIWQLVAHMIFWRESWLRRAKGAARPTKEEIDRGNFPAPAQPTEPAWLALRGKFEESQKAVGDVLKETDAASDPMIYFLPHDCYHFGQINYLRAMLGKPPIE